MARIPTYQKDANISDNDFILGSDGDNNELATKNFYLGAIAEFAIDKLIDPDATQAYIPVFRNIANTQGADATRITNSIIQQNTYPSGSNISISGTLDAIKKIQVKGDGSVAGQLELNCEQNSHGVAIQSPPHSAGASYTMILPVDMGTAGKQLTTDGIGQLYWADPEDDNLNIEGDSGSATIDLDTQSLRINGATNEITTNARQGTSSGIIDIGLPANVIIKTDLTIGNDLQVDNDAQVDGSLTVNNQTRTETLQVDASATILGQLDVQNGGQEVASFKSENTVKGGITFENSAVSNKKAHLFIRTSGDGKGRICLGHSDNYQSFDNLKIEKKPNNTYTDANMAFGGDGVADHNKFRLRWRHDVADVTDAYNGYSSNGVVTGSTALTEDRTVSGVNAVVESTASGGNQTNELRLKGLSVDVDNQGAGDANHAYGVFASAQNSKTAAGSNQTDITGGFLRAYNTASTGTVDTMYGVNGIALVESTGGSIGNAHGVNGRVTINSTANSPITEKAAGGYFATQLESSNNNLVAEVNGVFAKNTVASDIADAAGLEVVNDIDAGTVSNAYLIKGDVQLAGGASITNNFGIYLNGVSKNFLDGQVGVNKVPSAQLDVKNQAANTNAFRVLSSNNVGSLILREDSSSNAELTLRDGLGNTTVKLDTTGNCFMVGSTKLGVGTTAPASKLSVLDGDIEVETIASGLILKSPNGTRYRITVDNSGNLSASVA